MAAHQAPPSLGSSRQEHWSGLPSPSPMHESEKWKWSCSVVSDSLRPHRRQPTRLLRPWDFPGKSTGVGCHCLLWYTPLTTIISRYRIFLPPWEAASYACYQLHLLFHPQPQATFAFLFFLHLWTARRSNQSILKKINPEYLLEGLMLKLKL